MRKFMMGRYARWLLAAAVVPLALAGCRSEKIARDGRAVIERPAQELQVSPSGEHVVTLVEPGRPAEPNVPRDVVVGKLTLAPVGGGEARVVGEGVSNLPGAFRFSPDGGFVACLSSFSFGRGSGELRLSSTAGGEPRVLGDRVTFYGFSPDGKRLAWVNDGELLMVSTAGGEPKSITSGVSLMEFGPKGTPGAGRMLVKRSVRSGASLLVYDIEKDELKAVAREVGNFRFAPSGDRFVFEAKQLLDPKATEQESAWSVRPSGPRAPGLYLARGDETPRRLNEVGAGEFAFSPNGRKLAFTTPPEMGRPIGDLYIVDGDQEPALVAARVMRFRFGPDGTLGLLGSYNTSSSEGTLGLLQRGSTPVEVARNVKIFSFSRKGGHVLFSHSHVLNGFPTVALSVRKVDAPDDAQPRFIDTGVFGYEVDAEDRMLAYKARCGDEAKACSLFLVDLSAPGESEMVVDRAAAFEFLPGGDLAVITSRRAAKHTGRLIFTVGVLPVPTGKFRAVHDDVTGIFALAGPARSEVAFLVSEGASRGVFVADLASALSR